MDRGGQRSRREVSSLFPINTHQLCLLLWIYVIICFCCIPPFDFTSIPQAVYLIFSIFPPLFPFHFLTPSSCCSSHNDMLSPSVPPRLRHTTADLTISPIQPPKSNYHGQNRVIKSNGLLYKVHSQKLYKSVSTDTQHFVCYLPLALIN